MYTDPYKNCPTLKSQHYTLRLVDEKDANDLLLCYSDKASVELFNSDNCPMDFYFNSEKELLNLIQFWLYEYSYGGYVRFAVVHQEKAIGTVEIFAKEGTYDIYGRIGTLRLDLVSSHETIPALKEIFELLIQTLGHYFKIDYFITKVVPKGKVRAHVLNELNFNSVKDKRITPYDHYYIGKVHS